MSFDRSPSDADRLVAHMQPQVPRPSSPSDDDDHSSDASDSSASQPPSSQDPYYSNDDIAILHTVVAAAQQLLDYSPEPKPILVKALFKAYDAVLPDYGIDPDEDQHLASFIFRIGGDTGDGTLIDKFQAILNRMGIVLEFGNTSESSRTSRPTSPAFSSSSRQEYNHRRQDADDLTTEEVDLPQQSVAPATTSPGAEAREEVASSYPDLDDDEAQLRSRRAALSDVMGRWRSLALRQREIQAQQITSDKNETEEKAQGSGNAVRPLNYGFLDRESRGNALSVVDEEPAPQTLVNEPSIDMSAHHNSLRSLLDRPHLPGIEIEGQPIDQVLENESIDRPTQVETRMSQVEQQVPGDHSQKNTLQGVFPPVVQPQHATPQVDAVEDKEDQDLTQRPMTPTEPPKTHAQTTPVQSQREVDPAELEERHQRLLRQASRARELYLASKVFNHWADRTARRLERDAVARRHMIRYRYFRTWTQAPSFREPTTDHMRAAVAVKKWQRIVTQDDNLGSIAKKIAETHRLKRIQQVLNQWSYHRLQHVGRGITASRSMTKALSSWTAQASGSMALAEATKAQIRHRRELGVLDKWKNHTDKEMELAAASRRIGAAQQSFNYLREWWDQAELGRRAAAYRQHLMAKKASFAFDQWNLQARAQAFIWQREYVSANRIFDKWCQSVEQKRNLLLKAKRYYEDRSKFEVLQCMHHVQERSTQLSHMEGRACLYLRGTRMLNVLNKTVQLRKDRDKEYVKRYLMARYTEMSSARKKRSFFAALDKWRAFTTRDQGQAQTASELQARGEAQQQIAALQLWNEQADTDQKRLRETRLQHSQSYLRIWRDHAEDLEQRDMEAWQLWAVSRQRNCLKEWSISSLQQSGQAHTALEVQKKHNRERRNRYLHHWRQLGDRPRSQIPGFDSQRASTYLPGGYRGSWIALSGRRSVIRRNEKTQDFPTSPVETPTRWTGQPIIMTGMLPGSSMAPVREADEDDGASSDGDDVEMIASPSKKPQDRRAERFMALPSTTPRAPVPSHLENDFRQRLGEPAPTERGKASWSTQRMPTSIPQRATQSVSLESELTQPEHVVRSASLLRPIKPVGYGRINETSLGPQPVSRSLSRAMGSKSVGAKASGLRYGVNQSPSPTPLASSVRIQSPKSYSVTTKTSAGASKGEMSRSGQQPNNNAVNR